MKKLALISIALFAAHADATLVDFSGMPVQANYSGNSDFTVTTYGGPETDVNLFPHLDGSYLVNSSDPANVNAGYPTEDIIDFDFFAGLDSLTLNMYWAGNPLTSGSTGVTATSFDINGNVLQQFGFVNDIETYHFDSAELIYSIQTNTNLTTREDWWYGIQSIEYTVAQVPEPTSIALLGLGLAGLGFAGRRKAK